MEYFILIVEYAFMCWAILLLCTWMLFIMVIFRKWLGPKLRTNKADKTDSKGAVND